VVLTFPSLAHFLASQPVTELLYIPDRPLVREYDRHVRRRVRERYREQLAHHGGSRAPIALTAAEREFMRLPEATERGEVAPEVENARRVRFVLPLTRLSLELDLGTCHGITANHLWRTLQRVPDRMLAYCIFCPALRMCIVRQVDIDRCAENEGPRFLRGAFQLPSLRPPLRLSLPRASAIATDPEDSETQETSDLA
jgi:hypothetical protein